MASFQEHLNQAKENLKFLEQVNQNLNNFWDWQVTVCFYVAIHLVNAHLANLDIHYESHNKIENAINPYTTLAPGKFNEERYIAYMKLKGLSNRSRYLRKERTKTTSEKAFFTYDIHLGRSIRHLEIIINYLDDLYKLEINPIKITCREIRPKEKLNYFIKT